MSEHWGVHAHRLETSIKRETLTLISFISFFLIVLLMGVAI